MILIRSRIDGSGCDFTSTLLAGHCVQYHELQHFIASLGCLERERKG